MEKITKKRFKTVGVLELRTRIYDSKMIKAISDLWINRAGMYRNCKNDFINDLISRGIEALMFEEENENTATIIVTMRATEITDIDFLEREGFIFFCVFRVNNQFVKDCFLHRLYSTIHTN